MSKRIAIQGFEGCFHQIAAENYFGKAITIDPCVSFGQVVHRVVSEESDLGLMAIENSTAGTILQNYDLLQRSSLYIIGEIYLRIRQHLIMMPGCLERDIKEVRSHPMALYQCRAYLEEHPDWEIVESKDTALSVKHLSERKLKDVAVIASDLAADIYGMQIVKKDINTEKTNYTRFLVLSRAEKKRDAAHDHKASLYFQTDDTPGSLAEVLACFGRYDINLSKLQSFPIPGLQWRYYFHSDLEFLKMDQFDQAIECIKPITKKLRILGIYNRGRTI